MVGTCANKKVASDRQSSLQSNVLVIVIVFRDLATKQIRCTFISFKSSDPPADETSPLFDIASM